MVGSRAWAMVLVLLGFGCAPPTGVSHTPIIDGVPVMDGDFYGTVGLRLPLDKGEVCTGTLIRPNVVVTAAHCVLDTDDFTGEVVERRMPSEIVVVAGDPQIRDGDPAFDYDVQTIIPHEAYPNMEASSDPSSLGEHHDDIALLVLTRNVVSLTPVEVLPVAELDTFLTDGEFVTLTGYGARAVESGVTTMVGDLYIADAPYLDRSARDLLVGALDEADLEPDSCEGDSGGPGYVFDGVTPFLVGASSRARADGFPGRDLCGSGGVYTLVPAYATWIGDKLGESPPPADGGPTTGTDAGVLANSDGGAAAGVDAGPGAGDGDGGCGCHAGNSRSRGAIWLLAVVALGFLCRHRR